MVSEAGWRRWARGCDVSAICVQIVVMGVAGSGKTDVGQRLAAELGWPFVEGDDLHPQGNIAKMSAGIPLTDADRLPWLAALAEVIARSQAQGESTILTCSALRRRYRDILRNGLAARSVFFLHLHAGFALLRERLSGRSGHFMPVSLLQSQLATLELLQPDEYGSVVDVTPSLDIVVAQAVEIVRHLR